MPDGAARILVATDGSQHAIAAARFAASLLNPDAVERITVVAVKRPFYLEPLGGPGMLAPLPQSAYDELTRAADESVRQAVTATMEALGPLAGRARTVLREGRAADEIVKLAAEEAADLIVIGSRGWGQARAVLLGSVSEQVLHSAHCQVLIARPPETA